MLLRTYLLFIGLLSLGTLVLSAAARCGPESGTDSFKLHVHFGKRAPSSSGKSRLEI